MAIIDGDMEWINTRLDNLTHRIAAIENRLALIEADMVENARVDDVENRISDPEPDV